MATVMATRQAVEGKSRRTKVTDHQRANAILWLGLGRAGEEVVYSSEVESILRTIPATHAVRVRRTADGAPVYRATAAGQKWAVAQLAHSPAHVASFADFASKGSASSEPVIETKAGLRGTDWRVIDYVRHVRTPWLDGNLRTRVVETAAKKAVKGTDRDKLTDRHTRDRDWVVVRRL